MSDSFKRLRIYTDEASYSGDENSVRVIAAMARDSRIAGMTIFRASVGFGRSAYVHRHHMFESDRSVVIEMVDVEASLRAFMRLLSDVTGVALATLEDVELLYEKPVSDGDEH